VLLINDILDVEKIESGKLELKSEELPLGAAVAQAVEQNRDYAAQLEVGLELDDASAGATVQADADRLTQVLTNLLSNAAKYSPKGGKVRVTVLADEREALVSVTDRGPGIPEEFRGRIFGRFAQADGSDTRARGGSGLGLSICKAIVERLGGRIWFETETGAGTTFHVALPRAARPVPVDSPARAQAGASGREAVLVCEDDADVATLLRLVVERAGLVADVARDAATARALLASRRYVAMTLDLLLPGEDGVSLLRWLRSSASPASTLPVVVVSGSEDGPRRLLSEGLVVQDWLEKPIDPTRLARSVSDVTRGGRRRGLHVEDDPDIRRVVAGLLGPSLDLEAVGTLAEARAALAARPYDVVLLDLSLPDGRGSDLIGDLRRAAPDTPVVVFSAHDAARDHAREVAAALVKSRTSDEALVATVRRVIEDARQGGGREARERRAA
jgi:DNA-binding response OmpR family regulator/anti-sigma regulatory factor (Ser/Thr protein kinase)